LRRWWKTARGENEEGKNGQHHFDVPQIDKISSFSADERGGKSHPVKRRENEERV